MAPGVAPGDLKITCSGNHVEIEGRTGAYGIRRTYTLPHDADKAGATACLAHGVLTLVVPKMPQSAPRKLVVNVADAPVAAPAAAAEANWEMC